MTSYYICAFNKVICSSGIAGTVYGDITATVPTVHSFYGLQTADLPWRDVVNRATASNQVRDKIRAGRMHNLGRGVDVK